jgi:hypothetical protein
MLMPRGGHSFRDVSRRRQQWGNSGKWISVSWFMIRCDIAYALRTARKTPAFTAAAVISIALGIAANTTVFSMVNATLLGALPVRDPGGLYALGGGKTFPLPDYRDFRDQSGSVFDGLAGSFPLAPASLATAGGPPERVWGALVTRDRGCESRAGARGGVGAGCRPQPRRPPAQSLARSKTAAFPTIPGSAPKRRRHRASLSTTTGSAVQPPRRGGRGGCDRAGAAGLRDPAYGRSTAGVVAATRCAICSRSAAVKGSGTFVILS